MTRQIRSTPDFGAVLGRSERERAIRGSGSRRTDHDEA
jgi:hypothetical protein